MKNKLLDLFHSIKGRFLLFQLLFLIIILLIITTCIHFFFKRYFFQMQGSKMELIAQNVSDNIAHFYKDYEEQVKEIINSDEFENYSRKYQDLPLIRYYSRFLDKFFLLSFINKDGVEEVKVTRNNIPVLYKNIKDTDLFNKAFSKKNIFITEDNKYHEEIEAYGIEFVYTSIGYFGDEFIGICRGIIPLEAITNDLLDKKIGESGFVVIVDRKGNTVFLPDGKYMNNANRKIISEQELARITGKYDKKLIHVLNFFNGKYIVSTKDIPIFNWNVLILLPYKEFYVSLLNFQRIVFFVFLGLFFLSLPVVFYLSNKFTSSLIKLENAASRIAEGNYSKITNIKVKDEVQKVVDAFNIMVKQLNETTVSKDFAYNIIENISDFLFVLNDDFTVKYANRVMCERLNYTQKQLESMELIKLIEPADNNYYFNDGLVNKDGKHIKDHEVYLKKKDLTKIPILISMMPVIDSKGKIKSIVCIAKDITLIKQREEDSKKARKLAEEASKLKSDFIANISHEIRTPLNCIIGFSEIAQEAKTLDEVYDLSDKILHEGNVLLGLIVDLLDHAKIEGNIMELKHEPFLIKNEMHALINIFKNKIDKKNIKIKIQIDKNLPPCINGDALRLRQILSNLLSNAIKFTERGSITVDVRVIEKKEGYVSLYFSVVDTGIGIPEDKQEFIFERFTQVDVENNRKYGGTGLGMSISKKLVELMGGEIGVKSEEGKGSKFWFTIDFEFMEPGITEKEEIPETRTKNKNIDNFGTILVAEDYKANQRLIKSQLSKLGAKADVVSNGLEAIEACKKNKYDYIFMDCQMPVCDGYEATEEIRKLGFDKTPIIALTAHAGEIAHEECLASGMNDVLSKPIRKSMLLEILKKWHN